MDIFLLVITVFLLSILFSLLGLGGAIIYVPLFYWWGIELIVAITLSLLLNVLTCTSASVTYLRKRAVDLHMAAPFIISSMIIAPFGAYIARSVNEVWILNIFSTLMIISGLVMIISGKREGSERKFDRNKRVLIGLFAGVLIGMMAGMLGVGGGIFLVPLLIALGFGIKRAPATSCMIVLFSSLAGFVSHVQDASPDAGLTISLGIAVLIGGQIGSQLMHMKHEAVERYSQLYFKKVFGVVLLIVAVLLRYSI